MVTAVFLCFIFIADCELLFILSPNMVLFLSRKCKLKRMGAIIMWAVKLMFVFIDDWK